MSTNAIRIEVDEINNIIAVQLPGGAEHTNLRDDLIAVFREIKNAYQFDWLIDLRLNEHAISAADNADLAHEWWDFSKGRDVGRRLAVITADPLRLARLSESQATFPYRRLAMFETVDEGMNWLQSISGRAAGTDIQLI